VKDTYDKIKHLDDKDFFEIMKQNEEDLFGDMEPFGDEENPFTD